MMSRRPSITIYDYPEDLNPFKDDGEEINGRLPARTAEAEKKKFWTFGKNKKKRSHSFSIKSTWNGIFGKKKESIERSPNISTVSSTYQRASYNGNPPAPPRSSRDQQEFDEALGTLARRRKHTLDNSSRYSSSLTMNGDPGRLYEGCPQETTVSIMGDLTPKPPARRFGQVSPKPTDEIPPLDYSGQKGDEKEDNETPIPPKRGGFRSSQRLAVPQEPEEPVQMRNGDYRDENENMQEDFVFKRCSNDAVRKSNLSINSCMSVGSVYASGRKKRRAPLPPGKRPESLEKLQEPPPQEEPPDPLELSRVAEGISEMTKRTQAEDFPKETAKVPDPDRQSSAEKSKSSQDVSISTLSNTSTLETSPVAEVPLNTTLTIQKSEELEKLKELGESEDLEESKELEKSDEIDDSGVKSLEGTEELNVEFIRTPEDPVEIIKDVSTIDDDDDVVIRESVNSNIRRESFSVKEEIEKIEKQIKRLESTKPRTRTSSFTSFDDDDIKNYRTPSEDVPLQRGGTRRSLQETRRNFFRDLTRNGSDDFKIELGKLPREQREIKIVRLGEGVAAAPQEVKIIELHITEPIRQKVEGDCEVNPIPKPRRQKGEGETGEK